VAADKTRSAKASSQHFNHVRIDLETYVSKRFRAGGPLLEYPFYENQTRVDSILQTMFSIQENSLEPPGIYTH
jgi:hypothetical protein